MTPELKKTEEIPDGAELDATRRISTGAADQAEATEPEETKSALGSLRDAYLRARDGRKRGQPEKQSRTAKSVDRSKGLLVCAVAVIIVIFVFLGMFSSSSGTKDRATNRTKPSLGRPDVTTGTADNRGSVTPLLNADMSCGGSTNSDQLSADDVKATGRLRVHPQPKPGDTLASIPPMDPALEAYRQARAGNPAPQLLPVAVKSRPLPSIRFRATAPRRNAG